MPELPEVETIVRDLRKLGVRGRRITGVQIRWRGVIETPAARRVATQLVGQCIRRICRRGKFIIFALSSGDHLLIHLRMTGRLSLHNPQEPTDSHDHVILSFDDGRELRFRDPRKFGRWLLVRTPDVILQKLGPEPLSSRFTFRRFRAVLSKHTGRLKSLLLDQRVIAGLGNIYADEALWEAGLHPLRRCDTLSRAEQKQLYGAIRGVLRRAIRARGTSLGMASTNFHTVTGELGKNRAQLRVHGRAGLACPRCGTSIARLRVAQRGTYICPNCQKSPD
ncbi:MAG: bifunctional DNA-formamidopyrimidine glycosylase/DNA-(apurinic or apyrimidinic site) lyase [Kiritimatiellia bacterium]